MPAPLEAAPSTWPPSVLYLQPDYLLADSHTDLTWITQRVGP